MGCSHTSCITSLSFHGWWGKNILLEHGAKDDLSLGFKWALVALVSCQLLQMSMPYFYHVVISCMQHVQLILRISHVEKELQNNERKTFLRKNSFNNRNLTL